VHGKAGSGLVKVRAAYLNRPRKVTQLYLGHGNKTISSGQNIQTIHAGRGIINSSPFNKNTAQTYNI